MDALVVLVNFVLATAMWLILGRLFLGLFIVNPQNPVWQMFLIATEPVYRVSRLLVGTRVPERWIWLVSLAWLFVARLLVASLHSAPRP